MSTLDIKTQHGVTFYADDYKWELYVPVMDKVYDGKVTSDGLVDAKQTVVFAGAALTLPPYAGNRDAAAQGYDLARLFVAVEYGVHASLLPDAPEDATVKDLVKASISLLTLGPTLGAVVAAGM